MKATTIKVEGELLKQLNANCPSSKSLSAFIREILTAELKRRKMRSAAKEYVQFLNSHPREKEELEEWESAHLTVPPKRRSK